uniref:Ig-like domain-containing protein n=1 Tax=Marinagarivorans algicola TaxID=1513270 RepID=UPI000AA7E0AD
MSFSRLYAVFFSLFLYAYSSQGMADPFTDSFTTTQIEKAEDSTFKVTDFLTPGQSFIDGGFIPDVVGADVAYTTSMTQSVTFDYGAMGLTPTTAIVTILGSQRAGDSNNNENAFLGEIVVNLERNYHGGQVVVLVSPDDPIFSWSNQALGAKATQSTKIAGVYDTNVFDLTVSVAGNTIQIVPEGSITVPDQLAYHIKYFDDSDDSIKQKNVASQTLKEGEGINVISFPIAAQTDIIDITVNGGEGGNSNVESMITANIMLNKVGAVFKASGVVHVVDGAGDSHVTTWAFKDYTVPGDLTTTDGAAVAVFLDETLTPTEGVVVGDIAGTQTVTGGGANDDIDVTRLGPKLYFNGAGELIIEQRAEVQSDWSTQWVIVESERQGAISPLINERNTTVVDVSDTVNNDVLLGAGANNSEKKVDSAFIRVEIPLGSTVGHFKVADSSLQSGANQNRYMLDFTVDFSLNTTSGSSVGRRNVTPDLVSWAGVPFGTTLVTDTGLASGVTANHTNLTEFADAHVGGITIDMVANPDGDGVNYLTIAIDAPGNQLSTYDLSGGLAVWQRLESVRINNASDIALFFGGLVANQPDGSVVIPVLDLFKDAVDFTPSDNFNGTITLEIERANDPTIAGMLDIVIVDNNSSEFDPNNDGIDKGPVPENLLLSTIYENNSDASGDTVASILQTSLQSGSATTTVAVQNAIAITGFTQDTWSLNNGGTGKWQYSINSGGTWADVGSVSDTAALLLDNDDMLRYVPDASMTQANEQSANATISFVAWDGSGDSDAGLVPMIAANKIDTTDVITNGSFSVLAEFSDSATITINESTPPKVTSILRHNPTEEKTGDDSVVFRITFDEPVKNVDSADFAFSGTSASDATVMSTLAVDTKIYDITVMGLSSSNGTVNLDIASGHNITDLINNALVNTIPVTEEEYNLVNPSDASGTTTTISPSANAIIANGMSTSIITVQLKDASGIDFIAGGETVVLSTTLGTLSAVTDNGDGTYTATLTSATASGTAVITGTVNAEAITDDASVSFTPDAADTTQTT